MLQKRPLFDLLTDDPTVQTDLANDFETSANEWMSGWDAIAAGIDAANAGMGGSIPGGLSALDLIGNTITEAGTVFDDLETSWGTLDPSGALASALSGESEFANLLGLAEAAALAPDLRAFDLGGIPGPPPSSGSIPPITSTGGGGTGGSGGGGSAPPPPPVTTAPSNPCPSGFVTSSSGNCVPTSSGGIGVPPILPPILTGPGVGETAGVLVGGTLGTVLATVIPVVGAFLLFNWVFGTNWNAQMEQFYLYLQNWMQKDPIAVEIYSLTLQLQTAQQQLEGFPAGQAERQQLENAIAIMQTQLAKLYAQARATGFPP
jgi:hypothetical protein